MSHRSSDVGVWVGEGREVGTDMRRPLSPRAHLEDSPLRGNVPMDLCSR